MPDRRMDRLEVLGRSLLALRKSIEEEEGRQRHRIDATLPKHRLSAANLAHYLGLRKRDIRPLQLELAALGLSSLGRCEGHVRDTLLRLCAWDSGAREEAAGTADALDWAKAEALLHENTHALLGPRPAGRHVYIMVTAPAAAEATAAWAEEVVQAGADVLRINGAHETPREWEAIATRPEAAGGDSPARRGGPTRAPPKGPSGQEPGADARAPRCHARRRCADPGAL
jgi:pyruvate kinase